MQSRSVQNLRGIDVSNWQGNIDFKAVKNSGIQVVYMKATESNFYRDKYLDQNYKGAKDAGLLVGLYHFFRGNVDPVQQAQFFVNAIAGKESDCRLVLDIETTEGLDANSLTSAACLFLQEVGRLTGKGVCVYTYTSFAKNNLTSPIGVYPLWIADHVPDGVVVPHDNPIWSSWIGFQYASNGQVPGVSGNCDVDEFTKDILLNGIVANVATQPSQQPSVQYGPNPSIIWNYHYDSQIAELQQILNSKGYNLVVDGIAGNNTYAAVKNFTIELNDRGSLTKWVQNRINTLGFNAGYADGFAEQPTMDGIARFQGAHGLGAGYLGGTDWYYLIK